MSATRYLLRLLPWAGALATGGLLLLCYAPYRQGWLVWVALTPLLAGLWLRPPTPPWRRGLRDFLLGWLAGTLFFAGTFHWLYQLGVLFESPALYGIPLLLGAYLGLYFGFWSWFMGNVLRPQEYCYGSSLRNLGYGALAACAWVAHEWVRGWLFSGFGWNGLGIAMRNDLAMIQFAEIAGVFGLSWLAAFVNVMAVIVVSRIVAELGPQFLKRIRWEFSATMLVVCLVFGFGVRRLWATPNGIPAVLRIGVIQPNIPEEEKKFGGAEEDAKILQTLERWHGEIAEKDVQLVVWPEAAMPGGAMVDADSQRYVARQMKGDFALLMGSLDYDLAPGHPDQVDTFNGAMLFTEHGARIQTYRKMHLVPYGEYLPLRAFMPGMVRSLVPGDLAFGKESTVFQLKEPELRLGPLVCFEDTLGNLSRGLARNGADLLVNVTNDAWFGTTVGAEQHLGNALFRAVELRRPLLRCTNTGVTCWVKPNGEVERWLPPFQAGAITRLEAIYRDRPLTFYARWGDWVAYFSAGATLGWLVWAGLRRRRSSVQ